MHKVNFNPFSEIVSEDFFRQSKYIEEALKMLILDFFNENVSVTGLGVTAQAIPDMSVYVEPGRIYENGRQGQLANNLNPPLTLSAAHSNHDRIDRICACYRETPDTPENRNVMIDTVSRQITQNKVMTRIAGTIDFMVVSGIVSATPAAPTVPEGWISLAQIRVKANTKTVLQANIIDERPTIKSLISHIKDKNNPHELTAAQTGAATTEQFDAHANNKLNPHATDAEQVGAAPIAHKHTKDQITDFPTSLPANGGNADTVGGKRADDFVTTKEWSSSQAETISYVDAKDFRNLPPRVGYDTDNCSVPLYATFEFSKNSRTPVHVVGDNRGREVLYLMAYDGTSETTPQLFKAYRNNEPTGFQYINSPVRPPYLSNTEYIKNILGIGSEYIVHTAANSAGAVSRYHLTKTYGDSNEATWADTKNISSIITPSGTILAVIYFEEYDTIAVVSRTGTTQYLAIYKYSDLSVVYPRTALVNIDNIIDYNIYSVVTRGEVGNSTAFYNPHDEHLILYSNYGGNCTNAATGTVGHVYQTVVLPFKIPEAFFKDGTGATPILSAIPKIDYKWGTTAGCMWSYSQPAFSANYDFYKECIYFGFSAGSTVNPTINKLRLDNRPLNYQYYSANRESFFTLYVPDATPWSKNIYPPHFFAEGLVFFRGLSTKYGNNMYICSEFLDEAGSNNSLKLTPGKWWDSTIEGENSLVRGAGNWKFITVLRETPTKTRYIFYDGKNLQEITHATSFIGKDGNTYKGKRTVTALTTPTLPTLPDTLNYYQRGFDILRNRAYFIVTDKVSVDPNKQGYYYLLVWDGSTGAFMAYRDIPALDDYSLRSKNALGYVGTYPMIYEHNMLINLEGKVYFTHGYETTGNVHGDIFKVDLTQTPVVTKMNVNKNGGLWPNRTLSYDPRLGYNYPLQENLYNQYPAAASKSLITGQPDKTEEEFFNGDYYTFRVTLGSTIGLVAYLQATPITLGGYFSIVPEQAIALNPNCDNYIYFSRDSIDRDKVNIEVRTRKTGGEKAFNRVLVAKITTDADKIVEGGQTNYLINGD